MSSFKVSYTVRAVTCRQCKQQVNRGELRINRIGKQGAYHAKCIFDGLYAGSYRDESDIVGPSDIMGWTDLGPEAQDIVKKYIDDYNLKKSNRNPANVNASTSSDLENNPLSNDRNHGVKRSRDSSQIIVLSDSESEGDHPSPKKCAVQPIQDRELPNLLEGVEIPEGPPRTYDECSVCLDPPVHPITLPCSHIFCFLCAKGLTRQDGLMASCSLCRQTIPYGFLESGDVLSKVSSNLEDSLPLNEESVENWQWFYEGRNGWWKFEERNNEELEMTYSSGKSFLETMICGKLYVLNFGTMQQYQKDFPTRKRKIKRDLKSSFCKGVAGLFKMPKFTNSV